MKRLLALIVLIISIMNFPCVSFASSPESFMGFSVSDEWLIFSKDMTDEKLLKSLDLTQDDVNEILDNADCEYFLTHTTKNQRIYLKVLKNDVSYEFYNIKKTSNKELSENLDRILQDGFLIDNFTFNEKDVTFTKNEQMKFITIKGIASLSRVKEPMLLGLTFVNGSAIALIMHSDEIDDETIAEFNEMAGSISFTVIKDKDEADGSSAGAAVKYVVCGFCALLVIVLLVRAVKNSRRNGEIDA